MKRKYFLIVILIFLLSNSLTSFAQAPPQGISYQAIARDTFGRPISSTTHLKVKFSIYSQLVGGTPLFSETHTLVSTNRYGLFTLIIGGVDSLGFDTIHWAVGNKFLEVAVDSGNSGFAIMPRTQMMSVPYALYARVAGGNWTLLGNAVSGSNFIGTTNTQPLILKTNNVERMRISVNGNVGIGINTPGAGLVVGGSGLFSAALGLQNTIGGTEWRISSASNGTLNFIKFPGTPFVAMTIDSLNGYVGIGTTTPSAKLEINGQIKITGGTPGLGKVLTSDANGLASWQPSVSSGSVWTVSGANIYNNNAGNVGVGTTNPGSKLDISSSLSTNSGQTENVTMNYASSASSGGVVSAGNFTTNFSGIGGAQLVTAVTGHLYVSGTSTSQYGAGGWFDAYSSGTGTISNSIGVLGMLEGTGTASVTNAYAGMFISSLSTGITNGYGVYVGQTYGTHKWSLYAADASSPSYFAGSVGVGTPTPNPAAMLDVAGTINITGDTTKELNRTQTGAANLVPIAYGNIAANGNINASTGNFSVTLTSGQYIINIAGENYTSTGYITMVTAIGGIIIANLKVETGSAGGHLVITMVPPLGGTTQNAFQFITYKP